MKPFNNFSGPSGRDYSEGSVSFSWQIPAQIGNIIGGNNRPYLPAFGIGGTDLYEKPLIDDKQELLDLQKKAFEGSDTAILRRSKETIELFGAYRLGISHEKGTLGYTNEEWLKFIPQNYREKYREALEQVFRGEKERFDIFYPLTINGETLWVLSEGRISGGVIIGTMKNVTRHINTYMSIQELSYTDGLTGLVNRSGFIKKITGLISSERMGDTGKFSVLFIDLDGFKAVNDSLGHTYGDNLLQQIAHRLKEVLRSEDIIARMGGDEFTIALPGLFDPLDLESVAKKVKIALDGEYNIDGIHGRQRYHFEGGSIGIAIFEKGIDNADTIISRADKAMYAAKSEGTGVRFYDEDLHKKTQHQRDIIGSLKLALGEGISEGKALYPVYQPIYGPGESLSFEALLRFRAPNGDIVPPDVFIPLAEKAGLIIQLGKEMMLAASKQIRKWQESGRGYIPSIAVNVSALQLNGERLYDDLLEIIKETQIDPQLLTLEITESQAIENKDYVIPLLQKIKSLGIKISIDDFGTGYSSLNMIEKLAQIPLDTMKIDKGFIEDLLEDEKKRSLYNLLLQMGETYGIKVVVEGVENKEQLTILQDIGFQYFQGYHLGKPADTVSTEKLLDKRII